MSASYDEQVRVAANAIRADEGPPIDAIKHAEGECHICDALRLIETEDAAAEEPE